MLRLTFIFSFFCLPFHSIFASFDLPKGVYTASQLKQAKAQATQENKPLAFLYTNAGST